MAKTGKRAKEGALYYYIADIDYSNARITSVLEIGSWADADRFRSGNYFLTKKAATAALREVKKVILNSAKQ